MILAASEFFATEGTALIGMLVQTAALMIAGAWKLSRELARERREIEVQVDAVRVLLEGHAKQLQQQIESSTRVAMEATETVKDSLHAHEIYVRDNFARRDSFYKAVDELKSLMRDGIKSLEERLNGLHRS